MAANARREPAILVEGILQAMVGTSVYGQGFAKLAPYPPALRSGSPCSSRSAGSRHPGGPVAEVLLAKGTLGLMLALLTATFTVALNGVLTSLLTMGNATLAEVAGELLVAALICAALVPVVFFLACRMQACLAAA